METVLITAATNYHAVVTGGQASQPIHAMKQDKAFQFSSDDQIIFVENKPALNFQHEVTLVILD
jgi:hypothetical protein